jgi:hypothetical protein
MPFRKTAAGAHLRPDGCTRSWTLLRDNSKPHCGFWDNTRSDELRPARGIAFAILMAIPGWIALGTAVWGCWRLV